MATTHGVSSKTTTTTTIINSQLTGATASGTTRQELRNSTQSVKSDSHVINIPQSFIDIREPQTSLNAMAHSQTSSSSTNGTMSQTPPMRTQRAQPVSGCNSRSNSTKTQSNKKSKPRSGKTVICKHCEKPGHTKKACYDLHPELKNSRSGSTRQFSRAKSVSDSVEEAKDAHVGAETVRKMEEAEDRAEAESVPPSVEEPPALPTHCTAIGSPLPIHVYEEEALDAVLRRTCPIKLHPRDAIAFYTRRFVAFGLFSILVQLIFLGFWSLFSIISTIVSLFLLFREIKMSCMKCGIFYCFWRDGVQGDQVGAHKVKRELEHDGPEYSQDLRIENHSLKASVFKGDYYTVKVFQPNNYGFWINALFKPHNRASELVISNTLLGQLISDNEVFNDNKQLILSAEMKAKRNQRVYMSTVDVKKYGDIHGNTALVAAMHNIMVNQKKKVVLDFQPSPVV